MKTKPFISILGFILFASCSNEPDISTAREYVLNEMLISQAYSLDDFQKTNGYEKDEGGMKIYILEWEARVSLHQEIIATIKDYRLGNTEGKKKLTKLITKDGSGPNEYSSWERAMSQYSGTRKLYPGTIIKITGVCKLQKTENGWRVIERNGGEFKTFEIVSEGK